MRYPATASRARLVGVLWVVGNAAFVLPAALLPQARGPVFREDGVVETITALCFLAAAVVGIAHLMAYPAGRHRVLLGFASGLGLLGFLDEISFGTRLFGWSAPAMAGGGEFDGAHDVVILAYRHGATILPEIRVALGAALALIAALCLLRWRRRLLGLIRLAVTEVPVGLFALFLAALALAEFLDLDLGPTRYFAPLEELVELNAAAALLLAVLSTGLARPPFPHPS